MKFQLLCHLSQWMNCISCSIKSLIISRENDLFALYSLIVVLIPLVPNGNYLKCRDKQPRKQPTLVLMLFKELIHYPFS